MKKTTRPDGSYLSVHDSDKAKAWYPRLLADNHPMFVNYPNPVDGTARWGVANTIDVGLHRYHDGIVSQYVYVANTEHGTSNVVFRYGHRIFSGTPSVSIYPFGLGEVTPTINTTETADYIITFSW